MFNTSILRGPSELTQRRWGPLLASIVAHVALLGTVALLVLTLNPALPQPDEILAFAFAAPPPPPAPLPPPAPAAAPVRVTPAMPAAAPTQVVPLQEPAQIVASPPISAPSLASDVSMAPAGVVGGVLGASSAGLSAVPAPPAPLAPVRVGGQIKAPALVSKVEPQYPAFARQAHLQGNVVLEATVNTSGDVQAVRVVHSAGLLDQSAINAVRQWRYSPLRLNGTAVPFILTVTVSFSTGH